MATTTMALERRKRSYFFEKYCIGKGIDIGCGDDKLLPDMIGVDRSPKFDAQDIDAVYMKEYGDETFDFVYSAHCLEDTATPDIALENWYRILKPGGYLIVTVPHRDYYERKLELPSRGNAGHKWFFLPFIAEPPVTLSLYGLLIQLPNAKIIQVQECTDYYPVHRKGFSGADSEKPGDIFEEWQIEAIAQKGLYTSIYTLGRNET